MTISITPSIILNAIRGGIQCPVYLALQAAGYDIQMVGVGEERGRLTANAYYIRGGESFIQELPTAVAEAIKTYDKTGQMAAFEFELN